MHAASFNADDRAASVNGSEREGHRSGIASRFSGIVEYGACRQRGFLTDDDIQTARSRDVHGTVIASRGRADFSVRIMGEHAAAERHPPAIRLAPENLQTAIAVAGRAVEPHEQPISDQKKVDADAFGEPARPQPPRLHARHGEETALLERVERETGRHQRKKRGLRCGERHGKGPIEMCDDGKRVPEQNGGKYIRGRTVVLARAAVALVWLYEGLWCKLLSGCRSHAAIVRSLPPPLASVADALLFAIGGAEVALASWILSGWKARVAFWAQALLLVLMNGGGLIWGRAGIVDPASVVIHNAVLLALAWTIADDRP